MTPRCVPFVVGLRPSRLWLCWIVGLCVALFAALPIFAMLPLPWLAWSALAADGWLPGRSRVDRIEVTAGGRVVIAARGALSSGTVCDSSVALPGLIVLNLRQDGRRRSVVVFADSAPGEAQRQLRVFLRWFAAPAADSTFIVQADKS